MKTHRQLWKVKQGQNTFSNKLLYVTWIAETEITNAKAKLKVLGPRKLFNFVVQVYYEIFRNFMIVRIKKIKISIKEAMQKKENIYEFASLCR